ncbi:MAG: UTP--glucose-1-phosphate uridylyltransferase [Patescibacteria group bacterium]|nr:UTP--glucose-1-phosphate uridylyltransferase [Patescibacteria group bacterium]MDD4303962.1 UTP--glucose-1-phosphate uridylyltransferase [Patescibacteria group bacterium]MDD4695049.1 UTP--glucose-1-phosphate uridylyltransferase [Patescibacteria group bacterium]
MQKITKAVIAVAGSGTRFLPATKSQPKEMLPIVDKPIIQYVVEEMVNSGIKDIILVTRWDKKTLEDHFDRNFELEDSLEKNKKFEKLAEMKKISDMANFIYIRQKGPYGNGTPALCAKSILGNEPFIYAFGDDLVKSKIPFTKQLINSYEKNPGVIFGVQKVPKKDVIKYGIAKIKKGTINEVESIIEKPSISEAPSQLADFGRFVIVPEILNILEKQTLGKGNELWLIDAIEKYIRNGGKAYVQEVENGKWFTTGDPLNYLQTTVEYALDRKDLAKDFKKYLKQII